MLTDVKEVLGARELLLNLTRRELRGKYKGTALGWGWSLVNPLASTLIFTAVFSVVLRVQPPIGVDGLNNYALFLLCGLLTWNFFSGALSSGMGVLTGNGNLIKKTYFPRRLLVVSNIMALFVTYLIEMLVLAVIFLVFRVNVLPWIPLVLVVMLLTAVLALGFSLILSVVNVYFRDVAHFVAIALQIWFYATPIIYPITMVEATRDSAGWAGRFHIADIYLANPMVGLIEAIRDMWYSGTMPDFRLLGYVAALSIVLLWFGNYVFGRLEVRLGEEL
ncbi:ABC transporter permease [Cellulomonas sp.]|uniref:ABC transporter permease n=1 Tax=Cellulomonas sp. TaxID=40001 RepID=UPI002D56291F|nr:ABC transporter permease [Cellulomonas sp.]HYQ74688.1 ABC transporter permease [Cellulomonas sp.]